MRLMFCQTASNAGYLVLDSTAVIAAPDDVYVRTEGR